MNKPVISAAGPYNLRLFGGFSIESCTGCMTGLPKYARTVVAYLACHPGKALGRQAVLEALWPDAAESDSGNARTQPLRRGICDLRKYFGTDDHFFIADPQTITLREEVFDTDVQKFERLIDAAEGLPDEDTDAKISHYRRAAELYQGRLLPDMTGSWVLPLQDAQAGKFRALVGWLNKRLVERGRYQEAAIYAARLVDESLPMEADYLEVMRLYSLLPDPAGIERWYGQLTRNLRRAGTEPTQEAQQLKVAYMRSARQRDVHKRQSMAPLDRSSQTLNGQPLPVCNITEPLTTFYGRQEGGEDDVSRIVRLLQAPRDTTTRPRDHRLVTLMGPGGTGKTRLALEVASKLRNAWADQIYFVSLAELTVPDLLLEHIIRQLRLEVSHDERPLDQLTRLFSKQACLFVLDSVEHLVNESTEPQPIITILEQLRRSLPHCALLITSRDTLRLEGQQIIHVGPLACPPVPAKSEGHPTLRDINQYASVQLFLDRARRVQLDFATSDKDVQALAGICRLCGGFPLALELVAAYADSYSVEALHAKLDEDLITLANLHPGAPERHSSIGHCIAWSVSHLEPSLQGLLGRLSVFQGGCTERTAELVCEEPDTAACLERLQRKSLVGLTRKDLPRRYQLLEPIRRFAATLLSPTDHQMVMGRYKTCFLEMGWTLDGNILRDDVKTAELVTNMGCEQSNVRSLLNILLNDAPLEALCFVCTLWRFWVIFGYLREGAYWIEQCLRTCPDAPNKLRLKAQTGLAAILYIQGKDETISKSVSLYQGIADDVDQSGDNWCCAVLHLFRGTIYQKVEKNIEAALSCFGKSLAAAEAERDPWLTALIVHSLAFYALDMNDPEEADKHFRTAVQLAVSVKERWLAGTTLESFGLFALIVTHDRVMAQDTILKALETHQFCPVNSTHTELHNPLGLAECLIGLAGTLEDGERATRLLGAADALLTAIAAEPWPGIADWCKSIQHTVRAKMAPRTYQECYQAGKSLSIEAAWEYARASRGH